MLKGRANKKNPKIYLKKSTLIALHKLDLICLGTMFVQAFGIMWQSPLHPHQCYSYVLDVDTLLNPQLCSSSGSYFVILCHYRLIAEDRLSCKSRLFTGLLTFTQSSVNGPHQAECLCCCLGNSAHFIFKAVRWSEDMQDRNQLHKWFVHASMADSKCLCC